MRHQQALTGIQVQVTSVVIGCQTTLHLSDAVIPMNFHIVLENIITSPFPAQFIFVSASLTRLETFLRVR